jgi:cell wall-associated NlpC family hydrolase
VLRLRAGGIGGPGGSTARRVAAVAVTLALVGGGIAYSESASAANPPTTQQVQAQVNSLQSQVDQVGEQYDAATEQLTTAKAKLAAVRKQDNQAEGRFLGAQARLQQIAVASFETANQSSIAGLLTSGNPSQVLQQASLLEDLDNGDSAEVAQYLTAAQQVATAQANVQRTEQGITTLQTQLSQKKTHLDALLTQASDTLANMNLAQQEAVAAAAVGGGGEFITHATYTGPTNTPAGKAVQFVYDQLGCAYLWGGTGPCSVGFDCSGLMQQAWAAAGVSIDRTTYEQYDSLPQVSKADLVPGDLVFFDGLGHVAMYVGNGMIIDAPRTGEVVRMLPLDTDWYAQNYDGAAAP